MFGPEWLHSADLRESLYSDAGQISPWNAKQVTRFGWTKATGACTSCARGARLDRRLVNEIPKVAIRNDNSKCSIPEANFEETCAAANGTVMICDEDQGTGAKKEFGTYTKLSLSSITEESCLNQAHWHSVKGGALIFAVSLPLGDLYWEELE